MPFVVVGRLLPDIMPVVSIVGGGLVGSLAAVFMGNRGYEVHVYEARPGKHRLFLLWIWHTNNVFLLLSSFLSLESLLDIRTDTNYEGRSINLALSRRGIASLEKIGWNQKNVEDTGLPMQGRLIHSLKGDLTSIPYGLHGEVLLPRPFFCLFEKYFLKSCLFSVFVFEPRSAFTLLTAGS